MWLGEIAWCVAGGDSTCVAGGDSTCVAGGDGVGGSLSSHFVGCRQSVSDDCGFGAVHNSLMLSSTVCEFNWGSM